MKTKILIYIPTYNRSHLLQKTLDSVKNAIKNFGPHLIKVHISNNASTDDTINVLQQYMSDPRFTYDSNTSNIGMVGNLVKGLQFDLGQEYTWMVGDDDLIAPWSIETLFSYFQELDSKKISVKFIHTNLLVISKEAKNDDNIFNLIQSNSVLGFRWLMNSKFKKPCVVNFGQLVDPYVDDFILGSIMTGIFDSTIVREASQKINYQHSLGDSGWPSFAESSNSAWFPFSYTYFHSFSKDDLCLVIPQIFNVGCCGHQEWMKDRSIIIAAAFDGLFICFDNNIISIIELEEYSKKFFLRHKHHLSDLIKNRIELFSDRKREVLLKTYAWFVENHIKQ